MMAAREQAAAANFEAEQKKRQEQETRIAADQAETKRRNELTASLQTISAIRSGRGVGQQSPTALAILGNSVDEGETDVRTERLAYLSKADQYRMGAEMDRRKAKMSLVAGAVGAIGGLASAGQKIVTMRS
jgi:hypothetical protein